jgi:hypothetical protein
MLAEAAMRYLERYGIPRKFYELEVTKLPSTVTPGQTIRVVYYEVDADGNTIHDINDDLNILNIATNYGNDGNDGSVIYKLTVSDTDRFPMNDAEEMAQRIEQGQVYQSYTQLSSNSDTISHVEDFDTSTSISFPFWMGAEIAQVNQVLLRFRVDPLRSTVASSAAGSSHTHSVTINSHTHTIPGHSHTLTVPHTGSVAGDVGVVSSSQGLWYTGTDVGDWSILTDSGTGGTTSDSGGSSTPTSASESSHTHALTYGVYEDSGAGVPRVDTIAHLLEDVTIEVNNVAIVAGDLTLTSGYFVLDLTALESGGSRIVVTEDTFRPVSVYNTITVQGNFVSPDNHQGRFTGQLLIRSLVQATANI